MLLGIRSTVLAGVVAGTFYLLLFRLAIRMVAVDPNARTAVLRAGDIGSRSADIAKLLTSIFGGSHPLIGPVTAICTAAAILVFCIRVSTANRQWMQVLVGGIVIVTGILLAILPVSLSGVWWPMPRTLIALPLAIALGIAVLSFGTSRVQVRLASGMLFIAIAILSGKSGALLLNQQRLNRWDMKLAGEIIMKVSEIKQIDASTPIFIHRARWAYEIGQNMPLGDANTSALASRWTINPLFEEATGRQLNVKLDTEGDKICDTLPSFPNSGSIREVEGAVHVCL